MTELAAIVDFGPFLDWLGLWRGPEAGRLDWFGTGPGSANRTGAFIACCLVAAWWPALRFSKWGFWVSIVLSVPLWMWLVQTQSRGGILAAALGLGFLAVWWLARTEWRWDAGRWVRLAAVLALLGGGWVYAEQMGVSDRFVDAAGGEDGSTQVRLDLYQSGFRMLGDAPMGWGVGSAADMYSQWYQKTGVSQEYLSLINSHLTWMANYGVLFSILWFGGWAAVLALLFPVPWSPTRAAGFAVWLTLGVAALFSSVLNYWVVWLPAAVFLLGVVVIASIKKTGFHPVRTSVCACTAALVALLLHVLAAYSGAGPVYIQGGRNFVRVTPRDAVPGQDLPATALILPDRRVVGRHFGHDIREHIDTMGETLVVRRISAIERVPENAVGVFSGVFPAQALQGWNGARVVLLNPDSGRAGETMAAIAGRPTRVILGGHSDWRRRQVWQELASAHAHLHVTHVPGAVDFLPGWPRYLSEGSVVKVHETEVAWDEDPF